MDGVLLKCVVTKVVLFSIVALKTLTTNFLPILTVKKSLKIGHSFKAYKNVPIFGPPCIVLVFGKHSLACNTIQGGKETGPLLYWHTFIRLNFIEY